MLYLFLVPGTRKQGDELLHADLIHHRMFLKLIPDIFRDTFLVPSYRVDVISFAPEVSIPVLVYQIRMPRSLSSRWRFLPVAQTCEDPMQ